MDNSKHINSWYPPLIFPIHPFRRNLKTDIKNSDAERSESDNEIDIPYKYKENEILYEISEFINKTYSQHYAQNKIQAMEFIIDMNCGEQFCLGSIAKYLQRYGKKNGKNKLDLLKIIHYTIMLIYQNHAPPRKRT